MLAWPQQCGATWGASALADRPPGGLEGLCFGRALDRSRQKRWLAGAGRDRRCRSPTASRRPGRPAPGCCQRRRCCRPIRRPEAASTTSKGRECQYTDKNRVAGDRRSPRRRSGRGLSPCCWLRSTDPAHCAPTTGPREWIPLERRRTGSRRCRLRVQRPARRGCRSVPWPALLPALQPALQPAAQTTGPARVFREIGGGAPVPPGEAGGCRFFYGCA